ncbi:uncharacterized protein V1510DRAFT_412229 [Dipodascopsis tothii]|uniref:uncharacterized protein n=1 Tax=Dipodascopsis tothii TaxID=44089 RepID=UPI0034CE0772
MSSLPPHAIIRPLGPGDLAQITKLEQATLAEHLRSTADKLGYYLKTCPELCTGVFIIPAVAAPAAPTTVADESAKEARRPRRAKEAAKDGKAADETAVAEGEAADEAAPAAQHFRPASFSDDDVESAIELSDDIRNVNAVKREQEVLVAHMLSTKFSSSPPPSGASSPAQSPAAAPAEPPAKDLTVHTEGGDDICIHTLAVDPQYHRMKLGSTLVLDYVQRLAGQKVAKRVLVPNVQPVMRAFWERMGFYVLDYKSADDDEADDDEVTVWISLEEGFDDDE